MAEFSNNIIVGLLVVALVLTVTSTVVSLQKLSILEGGFESLTSAATTTASGDSNITINSVTSIKNHNSSLGFGSGNVNATCDFCQLTMNATTIDGFSNGTTVARSTTIDDSLCCAGFTSIGYGFVIENIGNTNLSVGYTCSELDGETNAAGNCTYAHFIGGTIPAGHGGIGIRVDGEFNLGADIGTDSALDTVESCAGGSTSYVGVTGWNITNASAYGSAPAGAQFEGLGEGLYAQLGLYHWLCGNVTHFPLDSAGDRDAGIVRLNVTIPSSAPSGLGIRAFLLNFNGTSS